MIIECQACHARFRLDESKIKGRGARVRCRRCTESILVMKDESPAAEPETAYAAPLPGQFDINLAMSEPPERSDDFIDLGFAAPPAAPNAIPEDEPPAAVPPIVPLILEPAPEHAPYGIVPFLEETEPETGIIESGFEIAPVVDTPAASPFLTETPDGLPPEISPSPAPAPPSLELDDVDLAFEQFLSGTDAGATPAAAPAIPEPAPPPADDPFELAGPDLLSPSDALDFIGTEPAATEDAQTAPPATQADPFAFQLDEETFRIPDASEASPFTGNTVGIDGEAASVSPPVTSPPPQKQQSSTQELPPPQSAPRERRPPEIRESIIRPGVALFAALFLALTGAGWYLGFTQAGRGTLKSLVPSIGMLLGGDNVAKPGGSQFDIRNLIGYYDNTVKAGRMFVIKGQVANTGHATKGRIRIHAALLDNTNKVLAEKTVYAGNVLGGEDLRVADKETIEKTLSSPFGEKLANLDVAPGKSVPFMVVFLGIPEGIDAYRLEAKEGE